MACTPPNSPTEWASCAGAAARRIAALTHGDRAAWDGTAVLHELVRVALDGADPLAAVESALREVDAIAPGGDTDTVAAVTGMPAGAVYGVGAIPPRWLEPLRVPLPGYGNQVLRLPELAWRAERLTERLAK